MSERVHTWWVVARKPWGGSWYIWSEHRTRAAALKAAKGHVRKEYPAGARWRIERLRGDKRTEVKP